MKVTQFKLTNFTAFEKLTLDFCPGINVLIGVNSTGKSHVMKAMYAFLRVVNQIQKDKITIRKEMDGILAQKLRGVFKPDHLGRLVRKRRFTAVSGSQTATLEMGFDSGDRTSARITTHGSVKGDYGPRGGIEEQSLFIPVHEFLSASEGFLGLYKQTSFDETYKDIAEALDLRPGPGAPVLEDRPYLKMLREALGGKEAKITKEEKKFYLFLPNDRAKLEAHLVSEGYRKLAGLIYLILNGSLQDNSILFWDEPEANLNPRMVSTIVELLRLLAARGTQIFVTTHDYLISQKLSLIAENGAKDVDLRFFSFYRQEETTNTPAPVLVEIADTLAQLSRNPILDEFAAHYDEELKLFQNEERTLDDQV